MINSVFSHFNYGAVVAQSENSITYQQKSMEGELNAVIYPISPGIEVVELNFKGSRYIPSIHNNQINIMEINYCLEGRAECKMLDGCFLYVGEGDLLMNTPNGYSNSIALPLGYYHGIKVVIDLEAATSSISKLLPNDPINFCTLSNRYFMNDECSLIQAKEELQHIFSGMHIIPKQTRSIYYELKVQELLLQLYYFDPTKEKLKRAYSRQQVDIVKQIKKQLTENLKQRFTIEELGRQYCISPTSLKSNFKGVYGISIAAYMKNYRIQQSMVLLCQTQKSIAEIAMEIGYESQSKFGAAFKGTIRTTPLEYRKKFMNS